MIGRLTAALLLGVWVCGPGTAWAAERQFRQLTLIDGRVITAEILATESSGLRVALPFGTALISFELLLDMVPVEQAAYDNQSPWVVYYDVPNALADDWKQLLQALPGVSAHPVGTQVGGITAAMAAESASCDGQVDCVVSAVASTPWKYVMTVVSGPEGGLTLSVKINTANDRARPIASPSSSRDDLWVAIHAALELQAPSQPAPKALSDARGPKTAGVFDERKVVALSFVPFPGVPSLAQKDPIGMALALGLVVPSTVLWVGAVGQTGQSALEFGALSFGGYYAVTVLANQVTGLRSLEKKRIGITATPNLNSGSRAASGGRVVVAGTF